MTLLAGGILLAPAPGDTAICTDVCASAAPGDAISAATSNGSAALGNSATKLPWALNVTSSQESRLAPERLSV